MALIKCEDCGREVSDKASACIHCGCPIEVSQKNSTADEAIKTKESAHIEKKDIKKETSSVDAFGFILLGSLCVLAGVSYVGRSSYFQDINPFKEKEQRAFRHSTCYSKGYKSDENLRVLMSGGWKVVSQTSAPQRYTGGGGDIHNCVVTNYVLER